MSTLVAVAECSATTGSSVANPPRAKPITICVPVSKEEASLTELFSLVKNKSVLVAEFLSCIKIVQFPFELYPLRNFSLPYY
jgi:hypothetical protein